jgi:hypothetical protein
MEVLRVYIGKIIDYFHDIFFDDMPTRFEKQSGKSIRPRGFIRGRSFDGLENLLFREIISKAR